MFPSSRHARFQPQPLHAPQPPHTGSDAAVWRHRSGAAGLPLQQPPCSPAAQAAIPSPPAAIPRRKLLSPGRQVPVLRGRTARIAPAAAARLQQPPCSAGDMYAKRGDIVDAQNVFDGLSKHDVASWNALMSAYAQQGQAEKVLQLYQRMQEVGVDRDVWTFVRVLQACCAVAKKEATGLAGTKVKCLQRGKAIHADCEKMGCHSEMFVANSLISMYGKCGSIGDAQDVLERLSKRDVVSWTAMLAACLHQGQADRALQLYEQMRVEGVSPNNRTFVMVLQACGMLAEKEAVGDGQPRVGKYVQMGKAIHADAWRRGHDSDVFVGNTLVSMYGKCGRVREAQGVFDGLCNRDVVSWNAMLASYVEQGGAESASALYEQMQGAGVSPDARTFVSLLQAYSMLAEEEGDIAVAGQSTKVRTLKNVKVVHAGVRKKAYHFDVFVGILLISVYRKCGGSAEAREVFDGLHNLDVASWNAMLATYCQQEQAKEALQLYEQMMEQGVVPDARTFVSTLQACGMLAEMEGVLVGGRSQKVKSLDKAKALHAAARMKDYYDSDMFVGSILITTYAKCGSLVDARNVFDGMWERDVVAWNAMLVAYVEQGQGETALQLYRRMQEKGGEGLPNEVTLVCVMQACSSTGSLALLQQVHHSVVSMRRDSSPLVANTLIGAYGRCASMVDAQNVFDALPHPDAVSWTALMAAYARQGDFASTLQLYGDMQAAGTKPDGVTFVALLSACSHAGLVAQGVEYFYSMTRDYGVTPDMEHYVSLVNLLGRAGCFARIKELLATMPMQPNLDLWLCLLGACQKHGKVELGEEAFQCAVRLHPHDSAAYAVMCNIYYDAGLWERADAVHRLRQDEGAWKQEAGQSWMESEQGVQWFVVGDGKQQQQEQVYELVRAISSTLERSGQVALVCCDRLS